MEESITDNENNVNSDPSEIQDSTIYTGDTVKKLSDGVLGIYQPRLEVVKSQLKELTTKQTILVEQLHNENLKLAWKQNSEEYQEMFRKIQTYRNKLTGIKTDMRTLHDRSTKLAKRATRLQTLKEKDDQAKLEQREKETKLIGNQ